jgi:hypothetical protein
MKNFNSVYMYQKIQNIADNLVCILTFPFDERLEVLLMPDEVIVYEQMKVDEDVCVMVLAYDDDVIVVWELDFDQQTIFEDLDEMEVVERDDFHQLPIVVVDQQMQTFFV